MEVVDEKKKREREHIMERKGCKSTERGRAEGFKK